MKIKFGENFRMLRNERGYSQRDLAKILHISQRRISYLESGVTEPDLQTLIELADFFGVTIDFLVGRTDY